MQVLVDDVVVLEEVVVTDVEVVVVIELLVVVEMGQAGACSIHEHIVESQFAPCC